MTDNNLTACICPACGVLHQVKDLSGELDPSLILCVPCDDLREAQDAEQDQQTIQAEMGHPQ